MADEERPTEVEAAQPPEARPDEAPPTPEPATGPSPVPGSDATLVADTPRSQVATVAPDGPPTVAADPHRALPRGLAELNEAVPAEPPPAGDSAVGTIPGNNSARAWAREQAANWRLYLIRFLCAGLSVVITVLLLPGLRFEGWRWGEFVTISLVFGLLNMIVKPMLQFLSLRFIFNTYGLVVVLINTLLLLLLGLLVPGTINAERPVSVLGGGLVVGVLGLVLETVLGGNPPVLDRDYKERNGLK